MAPELASRIRRPSWRDPRLGVGVVLVAASVAIGTWAVTEAGRTVPVWSAARTLTPGESVDGAVVATDVSPHLAALYLPAAESPAGIVDRVISEGELIAVSALTPVDDLDLRAVVVPMGTQLSRAVTEGSHVDLWLNPDDGAPSQLVLENLLVRAVVDDAAGFGSSSRSALELLVSTADVGTVLTAMNDGGAMVAVPRSGS